MSPRRRTFLLSVLASLAFWLAVDGVSRLPTAYKSLVTYGTVRDSVIHWEDGSRDRVERVGEGLRVTWLGPDAP